MRQILSGILLLFLSLGAIMAPGAWAQQTPGNSQVRIWHKALHWIYEDNNKTVGKNAQKPIPQVNSENIVQFEKDLAVASKAKQDEYNFYTRLFQPVQAKLGKSQLVSNKVLIDAIVAEAAKKSDRNSENLRLALETITSGNAGTAQQNVPAEVPENNLQKGEIPATQEPENAPVQSANSNKTETVKAESNMPLYLSIAALLLAAFALLRSNRKSSSRSVTTVRPSEGFANAKGTPVQGNQHLNGLKKEIESLKKAYNTLKRENETWRADMQNAIQELQKTAYAAPVVSEKYDLASNNSAPQTYKETVPEFTSSGDNYAVETDHLFAGENQNQNQLKYTRVPEDGQLKDREMHQDSSETWSFIEITIPNSNSNTATFRINPNVNHALAINNSLDRLENAFEFVRSANKATHILNDADGELMRTAQGWQIIKRAKIHLA